MFQKNLLYSKELSDEPEKLEALFSLLPDINKSYHTGRHPHPLSALLNACIYKNLKSFYYFSDLLRHLISFKEITQACGFSKIPSLERLSSFVKNTPNDLFISVKEHLVHQLINLNVISGNFISADACPIKANVKENNLKTSVSNRFNKLLIPKADPDCRLGSYSIFPDIRKQQFFWGYRNFVLIDAISELPVAEITKPANVHESNLLLPQLNYIKDTFHFNINAVIADAAFDSFSILNSIVNDFNAKPVIAKNPRNSKNISTLKLSSKGIPICLAGFEMTSRGISYEKKQNRTRHKFICPIKASKKFAKTNPSCPWNHPNFLNNRWGCFAYIRVDDFGAIRKNIDYSSKSFKKLYNLRTGSERIFSRILYLTVKDPKLKGLNSFSNTLSIAHITILAIALLAAKSGHVNNIRFIKKYFPEFRIN